MIEWKIEKEPVDYEYAVSQMEQRVGLIHNNAASELVWLLEHQPLYTAGTSADSKDLLETRFPVYRSGRGGQYTYHGPGQRIVYVMLDLKKRLQGVPDVRRYIWSLEEWIIKSLDEFDVKGERREGRVGIWVDMQPFGGRPGEEAKIAAIGVRIRHWITYHGIAINVHPDLSHFSGIVPCGIAEHGVTSLARLGFEARLCDLDKALARHFEGVFGAL